MLTQFMLSHSLTNTKILKLYTHKYEAVLTRTHYTNIIPKTAVNNTHVTSKCAHTKIMCVLLSLYCMLLHYLCVLSTLKML